MFSGSIQFSESSKFTSTNLFSETSSFTLRNDFSKSSQFSNSEPFSNSAQFSSSFFFSHSDQFSKTDHFTKTYEFTYTGDFTQSTKFSISSHFTDSYHFSDSKTFSKSKKFSGSIDFTDSNPFSFTNDFTKSDHFTFSSPFTQSQPFTHSKPFSHSDKFSNSNVFSYSYKFSPSYGFSESIPFSPSASLLPNDPLCTVFDEKGNMTLTDRCDYEGSPDHKVTVEIVRSNFTDFNENNDGGAIRVKNCDLHCNGTIFINCSSTNGAGGGIFINNTMNAETNITLINLVFIRCSAIFGGAVFIRSLFESSPILVLNCSFNSNIAYGRKNYNELYGGSSLFLASKNVNVIDCVFEHAKGQGGSLRIEEPDFGLNIQSDKIIKQLENEEKTISISGCIFEQDDESEKSIFDASKNGQKEIEIINCNFKGKMENQSHYIDSNSHINHKSRFHIVSCNFEKAFNDIEQNYIEKKKPVYDNKHMLINNLTVKTNSNVVILFVCSSLLVILLIKLYKRNYNNNKNIDESINIKEYK